MAEETPTKVGQRLLQGVVRVDERAEGEGEK
jgi:hypothetical protein